MRDIYCDIIDNFGDVGFAIKVMNTFYVQKKESSFRFFGNNREVYDIFEKNLFPEISREYHNLAEIRNFIPSPKILNLFERKIDYTFLESFNFPIHFTHFSYFSLEPYSSPLSPGIQTWHGKIFQHKNLTVEQYAVSLLTDTGGVFNEKYYLAELFSREYFVKKYSLPEDKKWISIFCYPETLSFLDKQGFFEKSEELIFLSFGKQDLSTGNNILLPFLNMQEYYSLLQHCHANIVRGENSLVPALEAQAPFFWDIYKESNNAHIKKIQDFAHYLRENGYPENLITAQLEGNIERKYEGVKEMFLSYSSSESSPFSKKEKGYMHI